MLWIEGKSDDTMCPVRDGNTRSDPLGSGSLLGDIRKSEVVSVLKSGKEGRSRAQESTGDGERLTGLTQSTASRWHNTRRRHRTVGSDVIEVHPTKVQVGWGRSWIGIAALSIGIVEVGPAEVAVGLVARIRGEAE